MKKLDHLISKCETLIAEAQRERAEAAATLHGVRFAAEAISASAGAPNALLADMLLDLEITVLRCDATISVQEAVQSALQARRAQAKPAETENAVRFTSNLPPVGGEIADGVKITHREYVKMQTLVGVGSDGSAWVQVLGDGVIRAIADAKKKFAAADAAAVASAAEALQQKHGQERQAGIRSSGPAQKNRVR